MASLRFAKVFYFISEAGAGAGAAFNFRFGLRLNS